MLYVSYILYIAFLTHVSIIHDIILTSLQCSNDCSRGCVEFLMFRWFGQVAAEKKRPMETVL